MDSTMKENFCTTLTRIVEEEVQKMEEIKIPKRKVLFLLTVLFALPLLVEMIALACGKSNIGYWIFLPDVLIIAYFIIKNKSK